MKPIAVDFETSWTKDRSIGTHGTFNYLSHPETKIFMVAIYGDGVSYVGEPEDAPWDEVRGNLVIAHNYTFEHAVFRECERRGIIKEPLNETGFCTADMSAYLQAPRNLLGAARELLGVSLDKTTRDKFKGKDFDTLPIDIQLEISNYALMDAKACFHLFKRYHHLWPEHEQKLSDHTRLMGRRGINLDIERLEQGIRHYKEVLWGLEKLIPWSGEEKLLSPIALKNACRKAGIPAPESTAKNDESFQVWADEYSSKVPFVAAVSKYRSVNRSLEVLEAMKIRLVGERMQYGLKYCGAVPTFRWSGDSGLNCVTGDHEVLTKEGWVRIDQWNPDQEIAQWDMDGSISFVKAAAKIQQLYTGKMIHVETNSISLLATQDHRVVSQSWKGDWGVLKANSFLTQRLSIPVAGKLSQEGDDFWTPNKVKLMVALTADGCITKKGRGGISFGFRRQRKIDRLLLLLKEEGISFIQKDYFSKGKKVTRFYIPVADVPSWWKKGFGSWILRLSSENLQTFLDEIVHWDGYTNQRSNTLALSTRIESEAVWVMTAAHLLGLNTAYANYPRQAKPMWFMYLRKSSGPKEVRPSHCRETEEINVPVFCPTVPSSFWLTRRKGKIHVTGNCQNLPRNEVEGINIRHMLVPAPGKKFISADMSQIEPRVSLYLTGDKDQLDLIRNGMCVYEAHGRQTLGYDLPISMKEAAKTDDKYNELRQFCKARILGLSYGQFAKGFQAYAKTFGLELSLEEARDQVNQFKKANPKLANFWTQLEQGAKFSKNETYEIDLPSGRSMKYFDMRVTRGKYGAEFHARSVQGEAMTYYSFGKWHNNVCQGTARDVLGEAILRIENQIGLPIVLHVHDEVLVEVDEADAKDAQIEVARAMATSPDWMPGIPLTSDCKIFDRYEK
jgi:DNA polymerase I-like protein with 3'-5' exonuclease and polymerase domains